MTTINGTDCLSVVLQFDPSWHYTISRHSRRWHYNGLCPTGHDTATPSFYISEDRQHWWCFGACNDDGNTRELAARLSGGMAPPRPIPTKSGPRRQPSTARPPLGGATIKGLAHAKGLDPDFLANFLQWQDTTWFDQGRRVPAVEIPYFDSDNQPAGFSCIRVGITGDRFRARGSKEFLYGLWNLPFAQSQGYIFLVEGETDTAILTQHNLPALGLPGAGTWRAEWARLLHNIQVYIWQEPGTPNPATGLTAGQQMVKDIADSIPTAKVIEAPPGAKDPCELADQAGIGFADLMDDLREEAVPAYPTYDHVPIGTCFIPTEQVEMLPGSIGTAINAYMVQMKDRLYEGLMESGKFTEAEHVIHCFEYYVRYRCQVSGDAFLRRYRCGHQGCSVCALWMIGEFFNHKPDPNQPSKAEVLQQYLKNPVIYTIHCFSMRLPQDEKARAQLISNGQKKLVELDAKLTDAHGASWSTARDHCRGVRVKIRGDICHFQMVLLAEQENGARVMLEQYIRGRLKLKVEIVETQCNGVYHAQEMFTALMAVRIDWDRVENYLAARNGLKGAKLIQGKGIFYRVSGTRAKRDPKDRFNKPSICQVCGSCQPEKQSGYWPVKGTKTVTLTSPINGGSYMDVDLSDTG